MSDMLEKKCNFGDALLIKDLQQLRFAFGASGTSSSPWVSPSCCAAGESASSDVILR